VIFAYICEIYWQKFSNYQLFILKGNSISYIRLGFVIFAASVSVLFSQYRLIPSRTLEIPESYISNLQNDYRKFISLNGEWNVSSPLFSPTTVRVPFCYDFKGKVTCTKKFTTGVDSPADWSYLIYCDGINYQSEIKINGTFIIKHEGGFTPFSSPIGENVITASENTIEVIVDNNLDESRTVPLKNTANYPKNYGGIHRNIYILAVPKLFVRSINLRSEIDINLNADITNKITVSGTEIDRYLGSGNKLTVKTELLDTGGTIKAASAPVEFTVSSNSSVEVTNKLSVDGPTYWSPEYPYLYKLKVTISLGEEVIDSYQCDYGIYQISRKSGALMMNNAEFKFKGINYIEEFGGTGLCGTYAEIERDVRSIKSLGCNIIKLYGRPASPYLIDICNRYGLLIMEEVPVFTVPSGILRSENYVQLAENQLDEMISSHRNNPCIFAYGLGNDIDVSGKEGEQFISIMVESARKLDNRYLYYSTRNYAEDKCRSLVDFTGYNFYDGDLSALKNIAAQVKLKKEKIFISNFGRIINPSNTSGYSDPNSIEAQSKFIVDFMKFMKSSPFIGGFFHSFTDWNSDMPNLKQPDVTNPYMRTTGLFTLYREQRPPVIILRKEYLAEDIPNLNIGTYAKEFPLVFVFIGLVTFIVFIYLANSVRRFRENTWRALFRPFIFFTDVREQNLIPTFHNILLALILSIGSGLFFANLIHYWKDSQLLDIMLAVIFSNDKLKIYLDQYFSNPLKLTVLLSAVSFVKIFLLSIIIWLFSLTLKYRISFNNIYTVIVWGLLPTILLLVIGTFYVRIIQSNTDFVLIGLWTAGFLYLLSLYRIFKGVYLLFDVFFLKVYAYGILALVLIVGGAWYYLNSTKFVFDYFRLVMTFLNN
jgi:Glycosyl hydrolases family 2/Glycosyl hydrolases family 2, TIM barrel domain/Glycosyl hydrolases family 2, sugar binding domain